MERWIFLASVCLAITVVQGQQAYNGAPVNPQEALKIHQLQLLQHKKQEQRHLLEEQNIYAGKFSSQQQPQIRQQYVPQQQYQPQSFQAPQQQQYLLQEQQYQQPREPARPQNYHPPALVHSVNIGANLRGDYDFVYDTGKSSLGQSFRKETRLPDGTVKGAYGYLDKEGRQRIVRYTAGKEGFKAEGDVGPDGIPAGTAPGPAPRPVHH
ncbi:RNA polymerase II degradation factor 1-like [Limulus polyphemus]|uniref:RNA polymerase II degradation factor 1-like n=1 Tax=Limulus polyphemus TaxID=6850 RepID=A0ABM1AZZ4_LIMPO|nr:RNA polymerase II degradation factor 1-like [Limulus polyphemus]